MDNILNQTAETKKCGRKLIVHRSGIIESEFNDRGTLKRRTLKNSVDGYGYSRICMRVDGKRHFIRTHRLVAECFLGNPLNKETVNHINGVKTDNRVENLEWATCKENNLHARKTGLWDRCSVSKPMLRITKCSGFIAEFLSAKDAERKTGTNNTTSGRYCTGRIRQPKDYEWRYVI